MVAKGKDASDLFPAVVKNVVSKNLEVRFLSYDLLMTYSVTYVAEHHLNSAHFYSRVRKDQ